VIYTFADFELDADRRTLNRSGERVRVEARPLELLTYLVENRGRLVTKQELTEVVWHGASVSRSTLPITVHAARRAIGQEQGSGGPIATVGRQGYRFTAEVTIAKGEVKELIGPVNSFVGRGDVLAELSGLLSESRAGRGRIALLTGEAGIGKSRAARELASLAREFGVPTWTGHSTEGGGAPAFWTWKPVISAGLESLSERQLGTMFKGGLPPELDRLFPELTVALPRQPRLQALNSTAAHHRLHETLARLVIGPPSTRARLVLLEDLQWVDGASLDLLLHLSTRMAEARLLVIGTLRDHDVAPGDPRYEQLHQLFRAPVCNRIGLLPLTAAEVTQFVAGLTKDPDTSDLAAAIYDKTQGNPFFVEETVRWLQSEPTDGSVTSIRRINLARLPVPDAVRVVIRRRLRTVSTATQEFLATAAVIGAEFELSVLRHAATGDEGEQVSQLEEARTARLITLANGVQVGRFAHVLIRETVYQDLPAAQRGAIHRRIAELLERQAGPDPERFLNDLAYHYYRSLPGAADKAFAYCLRAARASQSVYAFEQACSLYERALEAWAFQAEPQRDHVRRCLALLGLAHSALTTNRGPEARTVVEDAIRLARALGRPDLLVLGVVLANIYAGAGQPAVESIREATEEALNLLPDGLPTARAYLLSRIASDASVAVERRRALVVQAMDLVSSPEDGGPLDDLLRNDLALMRAEAVRFCLGSLGPDDLGLCVQLATRAILAEGSNPLCQWIAHRSRAKAYLALGDISATDEDVRRSCQLAEVMRAPLTDFESVNIEGFRAQIDGRFDAVQRAIDRMADSAGPIAPSHRDFLRRLRTLGLQDERGEFSPQELEQDFLESAALILLRVYHFTKSSVDAISCRTLLWIGRREQCLAMFHAIAERGLDTIPRDDFYLATLSDLAVVCCELGDRPHGAQVYDMLLPYVALCAVRIPLHFLGPVAHFLGLLARMLDREAATIEHFEAAITISGRVGARPMLNRTRLELASVLIGRKDAAARARAAFLVEEGLTSARELRMAGLQATFEDLRSRLRERDKRAAQ
jgi:DNA-binding winged helix-turn-helix (wHTH) protein